MKDTFNNYIINLGVHIWAFSGVTSDKIMVIDLHLSKCEIVGFML